MELFKDLGDGLAVVTDSDGRVIRQLVTYTKKPNGTTRFGGFGGEVMAYATRKQAHAAADRMGWPKRCVREGRTHLETFYFLTYDGTYALACWDAPAALAY